MPGLPLAEWENSLIQELYEEHRRVCVVARILGRHRLTVGKKLREMGYDTAAGYGGPKDPEIREEALDRYADGEAIRSIADSLHVHTRTVSAWAEAAGIKRQARFCHDEMRRLYAKLGTQAAVAEVLGCSRSAVCHVLSGRRAA